MIDFQKEKKYPKDILKEHTQSMMLNNKITDSYNIDELDINNPYSTHNCETLYPVFFLPQK